MVSSAFRLAGILIVYLADGFTNRLASSFGRNGRPLKPEKGNSKQSAETVFWTLLVNATSVGMTPNVDTTPVPAAVLRNVSAVMDIVYAPSETRLLSEAKQAGCKTVNGAYMLLYQGVAQFELWTGRKAPVDVMKEILFSRLQNK